MYLYIDTTERESFVLALIEEEGKVIIKKTIKSAQKHSAKLLAAIDKLLASKKMKRQSIRAIAVVKGPGSFTSLRIGVSTANALAYGLGAFAIGIDPTTLKLRGASKNFNLTKLNNSFRVSNSLFKKRKPNIVLPEYGREPIVATRMTRIASE